MTGPPETLIPAPAHEEKALSRALDTVGDGTGADDLTSNYSTAQIIRIRPPAGKTYRIHRIVVHYDDNGSFGAAAYGSSASLTNGVKVSSKDANDADIADFTNGNPIKNNGDWAAVADAVTIQDWGGGDNMLSAVWTFATPVVLRGRDGESLCVTLQDDFTGLSQHRFIAHGVEIGV